MFSLNYSHELIKKKTAFFRETKIVKYHGIEKYET